MLINYALFFEIVITKYYSQPANIDFSRVGELKKTRYSHLFDVHKNLRFIYYENDLTSHDLCR